MQLYKLKQKFYFFFLFSNIFHIWVLGDISYGNCFDEICSLDMDHKIITENLKYFELIECKDLLNLEFVESFPEILICCEELNSCYEACDTEKKFCDDRFSNCLEIQCSENLDEGYDKDVKLALCLMTIDYHYSYKKLFGCEYFYYHKMKNSCIL